MLVKLDHIPQEARWKFQNISEFLDHQCVAFDPYDHIIKTETDLFLYSKIANIS